MKSIEKNIKGKYKVNNYKEKLNFNFSIHFVFIFNDQIFI